MIYISSKYACDFCTKLIDTEEDGLIVFGSVCHLTTRGLKAKLGEVPNEMNSNSLGKIQTCICWKCFNKKVKPEKVKK